MGDLRGRPILLYFFATFDLPSQANLNMLNAFAADHPEIRVLGVAVQPDARALLGAWVNALSPQFPVAYDSDHAIADGGTALGDDSGPCVPTPRRSLRAGRERVRGTAARDARVDARDHVVVVIGGSVDVGSVRHRARS